MKKHIRAFVSLLCAAALALGCASCGGAAQSTGKSGGTAGVTHITVWTYYNGDQLESFNKLVDQFNETTGREKGIRVESASQGSMSDLETNVMDAAQGKVGAAAMPNIFSAYADTAYALDQMGMLVDLSQYLTEDERAQYVQGYLDEGDFDGDGSMKIFPVAKSTELMFLNETDWEKFAQATGAAYDDLSTVEGLVATAGAYYDWTDAQTPEPDDGKALFGRDAMANYMLVGARQLGDTLFEVQDGKMTLNFDKDVARKLWDNYYVPFVKGWFAAIGRFRSDVNLRAAPWPPRHIVGCATHHRLGHIGDRSGREGRRDNAPLRPPILSLGAQQAVANQGRKQTLRYARANVIRLIPQQHPLHRGRIHQDMHGETQNLARANGNIEKGLGQPIDSIAQPFAEQSAPHRHPFRRTRWLHRHKGR